MSTNHLDDMTTLARLLATQPEWRVSFDDPARCDRFWRACRVDDYARVRDRRDWTREAGKVLFSGD